MGRRYGMLLTRDNDVANPKDCLDQIERLTSSHLLEGSDGLCRLIRFLAEHALNSPSNHLKEYQIATEALGRLADFDPHSDASVRVQVGRLRDKLTEYYGSDGARDPIVVEIPKGRYTLSFRVRSLPEETDPLIKSVSAQRLEPPSAPPRPQRTIYRAAFLVVAILLVTGGVAALLSWRTRESARIRSSEKARLPQTALSIFWQPFIHSSEEPLVVFKNLGFVGDDAVGMRRFDPSRDNPNLEIQGFTGIGEVMGILELDHVFNNLGGRFRAKRDGLFTVDDARNNDLIFVGSPSRTISSSEMPGTSEFTFQRQGNGPHRFRWGIVDTHPRAGETGIYPGSYGPQTVATDYAIVALKRGLDPSHWTLFLEGTSTVSTQAAADYVCNENTLRNLLDRLHITSSANLKPFESLLRVKVANDVPVGAELLELRETKD